MRLLLISLMVLFPVLLLAQNKSLSPTKSFGLSEIVQVVLQSSPEYVSAKNSLEIAQLESKNAFAKYFPSLDLTASHGVRGIDPDTTGLTATTPWVSQATLSLTENFYDNGETAKLSRISDKRYEIAQLKFRQAKAELIRNTVLTYYRYLNAKQNLEFSERNHSELERLAKLVSDQFHQGMKTRRDFLSFKTRAQRGRLEVIQAEKDLKLAQADLLKLMGFSPESQIAFAQKETFILPKTALSTNFAADRLPEVQIQDLQRQIGEVEVDRAKRSFWPEFSLVGAASYGSSDYVDTQMKWSDNDVTQWSILLNLKFNLVDWGVRSRNIQIAAATQSSANQAARVSTLQAEKDLAEFKLNVVRGTEDYKLAKELQALEEDTFKLLERDYRAGRATYLELVTGLSDLLDARSRGQTADYQMANLYLQWKYYSGKLNEENIFE